MDDPSQCELIEASEGDLVVESKIWTDCIGAGQWLYSLTTICTVQGERNAIISPSYRYGNIGTKPATEVSMLSQSDVALSKGQPGKVVDPRLAVISPVTGKQVATWTGKVTK